MVPNLHASQISSDLPVLTAHIMQDDELFTFGYAVQILKNLQTCVAEHFEVFIVHSTFQWKPRGLSADEDLRHLH